MIGELSDEENPRSERFQTSKSVKTVIEHGTDKTPSFKLNGFGASDYFGETIDLEIEPRHTDEEEDALLKESTSSFADWVASFIRRVILLLENLPEEGASGSNGTTESKRSEHVPASNVLTDIDRSPSCGCRHRCLQPDLCPSLGTAVRPRPQHGVRLREQQCAFKRRAGDPPTSRVRRECKPPKDAGEVLPILRSEYSRRA